MIDKINQVARKVPTWVLYLLLAAPIPYFFYLGLTGGLGREPIKALEHLYGEWALKLLIVGLAISPLRRFAGINLLKFRRCLGLMAFFYVVAHLAVWVVLDMSLLWAQMWGDIWKRPYITIGMAGFLVLIPLALTSNAASVRKLGGAAWRKLHKLTYVAVLLGGIHYIWLVKGIQLEPLLYMAVILILLALRYPKKKQTQAVT